MNSLKSILGSVVRDYRAVPRDGDYYGEDGALHCGRCHKPREAVYDLWAVKSGFGLRNIFEGCEPRWVVRPITCDCDEVRDSEADAKARRVRENRARCFDIKGHDSDVFDDDDGRDANASSVARSLVANFDAAHAHGQGLILSGEPGSGKTFIAACVANALLSEGRRVRFTSLMVLHSLMTSGYGDNRADVLHDLTRCDLVVLDDYGAERQTPAVIETGCQVIDAMYSAKVPMVVTTNLRMREDIFMDSTPQTGRMSSRIVERCRPVHMELSDRRRERRTEWAF